MVKEWDNCNKYFGHGAPIRSDRSRTLILKQGTNGILGVENFPLCVV